VKLSLVTVRAGRTAWADAAAADYAARIGRYFPFAEQVLKPATPAREAERLLALVPARGRLVAFDERGDDVDSIAFAALLTRAADDGQTALVFAIGGAFGFDPEVRARASRVVRLSAMVLNHAVARVVALEQVYRACTIRAGEPYHHA
jgi:23S rRNA (pseudouridine1915-N3)-methyltransferase